MKKRIAVLGSTGSIGSQTLDVIRQFPDEFEVVGLAAGKSIDRLTVQLKEFDVPYFSCIDSSIDTIGNAIRISMIDLATHPDVDFVMHATAGVEGLPCAVAGLSEGKSVGLSNKESIVMAGAQLKQIADDNGGTIIPIDSEPSALWQCIIGEVSKPRRFIITASGGAFRDKTMEELASVTPQEALKHPTWNMGEKITIDSATLMNKAFEVIETASLFDATLDEIDVVIHRQSIVHSLVEMSDGSIKAQLSLPDMRHPIQFALFHPERRFNKTLPEFDLADVRELTFEPLDTSKYPCFELAMQYARKGGTYNAVLAGADEAAVNLFLEQKISFIQIAEEIEATLKVHRAKSEFAVDDAIDAAKWAYESTYSRHAAPKSSGRTRTS
jgi:1-deoxy-D-xylulose-5-phosphate reductoisomerase